MSGALAQGRAGGCRVRAMHSKLAAGPKVGRKLPGGRAAPGLD